MITTERARSTLISLAAAALLVGPMSLMPKAEAAVTCDVGQDSPVVGIPNWAPAGAVRIGGTVVRPTTDLDDPQDFGAAVVTSDFDKDGCLDLLAGAPGASGGGAVYLINGADAASADRTDIVLPHTEGARFGAALAAERVFLGEPSEEGLQRIWIGAPATTVNGQRAAGAVLYYTITPDLVITGPTTLTQDSAGIPGAAEADDQFGEVLTPVGNIRATFSDIDTEPGPLGSGVVVGIPHEDIGTKKNAGAVAIIPAPGETRLKASSLTQASAGITGSPETGDHFGAALEFDQTSNRRDIPPALWIGVPEENIGKRRDAGLVHSLRVKPNGLEKIVTLTQADLGASSETGDRFGASIVGTFDFDCPNDTVAIGAPGEDSNRGVVRLSSPAKSCGRTFAGVRGAHAGDRAGTALSRTLRPSVDPENGTVFVGLPGADVGTLTDAGAVQARRDGSNTVSTGSVKNLRYGSVLSRPALNVTRA